MDVEKWSNMIREFALKQSGSFDFLALAKYVAGRVTGFDEEDEDRLFDLACSSAWLFEDDREMFANCFIPRHVSFAGAEFRVTPLAEEVTGGFLVPGHRLMPYLSREFFPAEAVLKLPDGSDVPTSPLRISVAEVHRFLLFYGQYGAIDYLVCDSEENAESLQPPFEGTVSVTVFDLKSFFEQCAFKVGDSLMLTVEDWVKGIFSVRHVPAKQGVVDFAETREWTHALRHGFDKSRLEAELDHDCNEQMARMLWLAECNADASSVRSKPPLSLAAFFNMQKDLTVQTTGQVSFFWPKDEPVDSRMMNSLAGDDLDPETELDGFFVLLGLSVDSEEAEAYMRDALSRDENDPDAVLVRVISGRTLSFPTPDEQKEFHRLWHELWDEVRVAYVSSEDTHKKMRSVFLDLNDQCLQVLRELDRNPQDPVEVMKNPATLQLGELSGLIHSALVISNQSEENADAFPVPLDEMAAAMSAAIEELSGTLQQAGSAESFEDDTGPVYQLKISLKYARPPIWRRVLVPATIELEALHDVIQMVFSWTNSHLHQFIDGKTFYQPEAEDDGWGGMSSKDSAGVRLQDLLRKEKDKIVYEYDFGDSWEHDVVLEKVLPNDPKQSLPVCIKGKRACPPDDCGGIPGYSQLLETLSGSDCAEKEDFLDWLDGSFDPEAFDLDEVNAQLRFRG